MALVGIIANPAASKDIRRLVAQGRVVPDWEKVNIVRRVMLGLQSVGVTSVLGMADSSNLVRRASEDPTLSIDLDFADMPAFYSEGDTVRAAAIMAEQGVDCLVTLGGDGTNRAAVVGSRDIPMVAISTGTNNVFPTMVEGTLAGLAAGLVADGKLPLADVALSSKVMNVYVDGELRDFALIDVALSKERFVASRAIWDMETVFEVFLTRAEPASIGLSSIGARLEEVSLADEGGLTKEELRRWYEHWLHHGYQTLENLMRQRSLATLFCYDDKPTAGDLNLVPQLYNSRLFKVDLSPYPLLTAIDERCRELPEFDKAMPQNQPDFPEKPEGYR